LILKPLHFAHTLYFGFFCLLDFFFLNKEGLFHETALPSRAPHIPPHVTNDTKNSIMSKAFLRRYASTYVTLYHKMSRSRVISGGRFSGGKKQVLLDGKYDIYETTKYLTNKRTVLLTLLDTQLVKKFPCVSYKPQFCY
jgi:hypothetical protein